MGWWVEPFRAKTLLLFFEYVFLLCIDFDTIAMNYVIEQTESFAKWLRTMKDLRAQLTIARRIDRVSTGHWGDVRSVGEAVSEMRIHTGPGYRVYFTIRQKRVVFLLVGRDKSTQPVDIRNAIALAKEL